VGSFRVVDNSSGVLIINSHKPVSGQ
jgi:hypothetical protein